MSVRVFKNQIADIFSRIAKYLLLNAFKGTNFNVEMLMIFFIIVISKSIVEHLLSSPVHIENFHYFRFLQHVDMSTKHDCLFYMKKTTHNNYY